MSANRKRKDSLKSAPKVRASKVRASKPYWKEQRDADGDVDMELPTVKTSPVTDDSSPNTTFGSIPLTLRIAGSRETPLFPTSTTSVKPSSQVNGLKDENTVTNENRDYAFDSFSQMVDAHAEELKAKPLRGVSKDPVIRLTRAMARIQAK
ncbi:hypothetical protein F4821DRAFT_236488 [Hypoxylon rubiginosum]|uniref:Uncharacterized protein n=1 Tax=Hypoxylon rubiginosum TaxID=110542 RepID=A0ACC0D4K5_9PEZI|nr:hypothetical protein F4821DRAFT_236488 [Hypoxylon rubiginosum]